MKLNMDIARDVMIFLEENLYTDISLTENPVANDFVIKEVCDHFNNKYLSEDVAYSTMKLYEAGFLRATIRGELPYVTYFRITDMTYRGHEFLESVRDENIYSKAKESMTKIGSFSLDILKDVGLAIAKSKIQEYTGVQL